jgi:hypothetical protein
VRGAYLPQPPKYSAKRERNSKGHRHTLTIEVSSPALQTLPAVPDDDKTGQLLGLNTQINGMRHMNLFWRTPEGKTASESLVSRIKLTANEYTETLLANAVDYGMGQPVVYNISGETKAATVTRERGRTSYKQPFQPPFVVYDGDKMTATVKGAFVDYWERVK